MATKKKSTKKSTAQSGKFSTGMSGFRTKGKNATTDGKNVTFDNLVHYIQSDMQQREGLKPSLELIKKVACYLGGAIADNIGMGSKVCVSIPEFGSFKSSVRDYNVAGKTGRTKTVKFTPASRFKEDAKLGKK
jgi:hypothetical protein